MAESLKILDDSENEKRQTCQLCLKAIAKYTCPRCNSPYCSVDCYRSEKHMQCSEGFYKDCFMEGLKDCNADPSEKGKVLEMLKRVEEGDTDLGDLDDEEEDLHERLADLDLEADIEQVWDKLTIQERRDFELMASDGRLGQLLDVWTPWWNNGYANLVTEVDSNPETTKPSLINKAFSTKSKEPSITPDIPNFSSLLKSKPSVEIKYNMVNVLYCYVFVSRLHNGDHVAMASESVNDFMELSVVLGQGSEGKGQSCGSVEEAIHLCLQRLTTPNNNLETTSEMNFAMIKDVVKILRYRSNSTDPLHWILCVMSDVYDMFKRAYKTTLKPSKKESISEVKDEITREKLSEKKKQLFQCVKKCEFLLSWCQSYGMALIGLIPEIEMVYALLTSEYEVMNQRKKTLETEWKGKIKPRKKILIQEL